MKRCSGCRFDKDESEFSKNKTNKDGLQNYCKICQRESSRKNRSTLEGKEKKNIGRKQYRSTINGLSITLYLSIRARAKQKNRKFDLTVEWLKEHIEPLVCEATGMQLDLEIYDNVHQGSRRPSIDRIDNSKGYTQDNCQIVSVIYNRCKCDATHEDVLNMVRAIVNGGMN